MADQQPRIFVAGHRGMVGRAIMRRLEALGYTEIITRTRDELDLLDQQAVHAFFQSQPIDQVYLAAAKVGGIHANNTYPADFIHDNMLIEANVIHSAFKAGVEKLIFLGSSCIYPRDAAQPMVEEALLTGQLEATNEPYAIAKIAGIKLCESYNRQHGTDYRSIMPTNLYGPYDNFHPENSHVIPGLIRRFHEAVTRGDSEVVIWGSGNPRREFLHVDDMACAAIHIMELTEDLYRTYTQPMCSHINIGTGKDCSIRELAEILAEITGFHGKIVFDTSKPDGSPRKLLDVTKARNLNWSSKITLREGLKMTYSWYISNRNKSRV